MYLNGTNQRTDQFINAGSKSSKVTLESKYKLVAEKETVNEKSLLRSVTITLAANEYIIFSAAYAGYANIVIEATA